MSVDTHAGHETFEQFAYERTITSYRVLLIAVSVGCLLWWPVDSLTFPNNPEARAAFAKMRIGVAGQAPLWFLLSLLFERKRWSVWPLLYVAGGAMIGTVGYTIGLAGGLDEPWIYTQYVVPQLTMLLYTPVWPRIGYTLWLPVCTSFGFFVATGERVLSESGIYYISFMLFCIVISVATGHVIYLQAREIFAQRQALAQRERELEAKVHEQTKSLMQLATRLQDAREEERQQIAVDLHDGLGQFMSGLRLSLDWLRRTVPDSDPVGRYYGEAGTLLSQLSGATREIVRRLRPETLKRLGLQTAVASMLQEAGQRQGWYIETQGMELLDEFRGDRALALYRILQEALNNVARHADASRVSVWCQVDDEAYRLQIEDDGAGFARGASRGRRDHYGLMSMTERATALGGRIEIESGRTAPGTRVTLWVPRLEPGSA